MRDNGTGYSGLLGIHWISAEAWPEDCVFSLQRGTRQGCPLSPLLFNLAIEPLAIWLRSHNGFEGISRYGLVHKLSLYADDLLLYISNPVSSLPVILDILDKFSCVSGYKINLQKSELFFVNPESSKISYSLFPFKIASGGFKYLGVSFTNSFNHLFEKNVQPLVDKTKLDMSRWTSLPLSLVGRINLVKMVILPKFLYLFQHIPICINKSFFYKIWWYFAFIYLGKQTGATQEISSSAPQV